MLHMFLAYFTENNNADRDGVENYGDIFIYCCASLPGALVRESPCVLSLFYVD